MKKYKRRQFIVDKKLQFSFMFISFAYFVLTVLVLGSALFLPLVIDLYSSQSNIQVLGVVADKILYLNKMFWPAVIFLIVLICCHTIYKTHKIAGPLYRFRFVLNQITGGDLSKNYGLRKGDYLFEEMDTLNNMIDQLRARISDIQDNQARTQSTLAEMLDDPGLGLTEDAAQRLNAVFEQSQLLGEHLSYFKVDAQAHEEDAA